MPGVRNPSHRLLCPERRALAVAPFLILGLFPALTDGVQRSLAAQLSTEELRGGAMGLLNAAVGLGALTAGVGGGYLWQTAGPATAYLAAGGVVVVGLVLLLVSSTKS